MNLQRSNCRIRHPPALRRSDRGDPAARDSATLSRAPLVKTASLNRSPSAPLGPPVSLRSPEDDERKAAPRIRRVLCESARRPYPALVVGDCFSFSVTSSSAMVGWTAQVASHWALVRPAFTAMAASWIISGASGPTMWTPTTF